ncbi:MAG: DNA repair protein RecO [Alphaproteobacteria bacterium]|nr:DNA repair protein RecO [Alphaproteobacteria bacterium]
MEWSDDGIILATRRHGESSVILEVMTRGRGRHLGLVRGGRSRKMQAALQPGNTVDLVWRARIDNHLGTFAVEPVTQRAADLMSAASGVYGIQALAALLHLLPERDPHPLLHAGLTAILDHLGTPAIAGPLMVHFELQVLAELGFGLDLGECAATGQRTDLIYVSPKSGRAVCSSAGAPYADRLLPLPAFLRPATAERSQHRIRGRRAALADAFRLTGYFLDWHVYAPRGVGRLPARDGFIEAVAARRLS